MTFCCAYRVSSACQLLTVAALGVQFAAHLPFAMLAQTLAFVMLNKVLLMSALPALDPQSHP